MKKNQAVARIGKNNEHSTAVVYTIGHSNVRIDVFLELLQSANIHTVIDCRSKPQSRWRQFGQSALSRHLVYADISYEWRGNNIGGLGKNVDYQSTLSELANRANQECLAIMCSEGKPEDCHRSTDLAPELEKRGIKVIHLRYEKQDRLL